MKRRAIAMSLVGLVGVGWVGLLAVGPTLLARRAQPEPSPAPEAARPTPPRPPATPKKENEPIRVLRGTSSSKEVGAGGLGLRGTGAGGGGTGLGIGGLGGNFGTKGRGGSGYGVRGAPEPAGAEGYNPVEGSRFHLVADQPLSTFSIDVDTASYANVRRYLLEGRKPPPGSVRIEELVNYFPYTYPPPTDGQPFATHTEWTEAPWAAGHWLVRIGIQGRVPPPDETPPRNLVFLVDVSGSMSGSDRLGLVQQGLELLARQLGPRDHVALVTYAGTAGVALPPTPGDRTQAIVQAIRALGAGGSTAGAEGLNTAYRLASEHFQEGAINRVILATDGDFNVGPSSEADLMALIEQKRQTGVFLTVLGVGRGNLQDAKMELLADKGNGQYAYLDSLAEAKKVLGAQVGATLQTVAKDVKIQVEFNPSRVSSYRLIGYENRQLATRDFVDDKVDAGEIGAGHAVTALYELVPTALDDADGTPLRYSTRALTAEAAGAELMMVKLRFKEPDGDRSALIEAPVRGGPVPFAQASADTRWAAAVAGFGLLLGDFPERGALDWGWVQGTAAEAVGSDSEGYRRELLGLIERARQSPS
jgi:Ca-activated chloride channel family protein